MAVGRWPTTTGEPLWLLAQVLTATMRRHARLAWYDIGAVLALDRLPTGRAAVRMVTASRVAHTPTAGKKPAIPRG